MPSLRVFMKAALVLWSGGGALLCGGCRDAPPAPSPRAAQGEDVEPPLTYIPDRFEDLYQLFLMPQLPEKEKITRWGGRYQGRWVRWSGELAYAGRSSLKIRHLQQTLTFDASLTLNRRALPTLGQLRKGERYTYAARLQSYDDLFRTFYLDQAVLLPERPGPEALVPTPRPLQFAPPPPRPR